PTASASTLNPDDSRSAIPASFADNRPTAEDRGGARANLCHRGPPVAKLLAGRRIWAPPRGPSWARAVPPPCPHCRRRGPRLARRGRRELRRPPPGRGRLI